MSRPTPTKPRLSWYSATLTMRPSLTAAAYSAADCASSALITGIMKLGLVVYSGDTAFSAAFTYSRTW